MSQKHFITNIEKKISPCLPISQYLVKLEENLILKSNQDARIGWFAARNTNMLYSHCADAFTCYLISYCCNCKITAINVALCIPCTNRSFSFTFAIETAFYGSFCSQYSADFFTSRVKPEMVHFPGKFGLKVIQPSSFFPGEKSCRYLQKCWKTMNMLRFFQGLWRQCQA